VCLLVNAKFFVPVAWLAWLPVGWLGWLCLGFLWLISEDDVIFRVDASFVNPVGVRFVWIVHCRAVLGGGRCSFTESLILAQDERWRRA
jgi:hypothetical protein